VGYGVVPLPEVNPSRGTARPFSYPQHIDLLARGERAAPRSNRVVCSKKPRCCLKLCDLSAYFFARGLDALVIPIQTTPWMSDGNSFGSFGTEMERPTDVLLCEEEA